ncbi:DUF1704 domain-containing protein [bacterium]|nr:DUF1704 domain-containing protein [candidate division CSSED10-310 bacterium]
MRINDNRWRRIDKAFFTIIDNLDLDVWLSPTNRVEEQQKTIAAYRDGKVYNPTFEYEASPNLREKELAEFIEGLDRSDPIEDLYYLKAMIRLGEIEMVKSHAADVVTKYSLSSYGRPSNDLLALAAKNLETIELAETVPSLRLLDAEESAEMCRTAMADYGFDWKVTVVKEFGAKAAVDNLIKEFIIRADVKFPENAMKTIVVHEIGTHILRAENGYAQPLRLFGTGLPNYMLTEEGLAEYTEVQNDCFDPETHRRISARAIATHIALEKSFWDVFTTMVKFFPPETAFDIGQRVTLGIADTSKPGSYTKDFFYLEGLAKVTEFFEKRAAEERKLLYLGKVGMHDLPLLKDLVKEGYLSAPKHLPHFLEM